MVNNLFILYIIDAVSILSLLYPKENISPVTWLTPPAEGFFIATPEEVTTVDVTGAVLHAQLKVFPDQGLPLFQRHLRLQKTPVTSGTCICTIKYKSKTFRNHSDPILEANNYALCHW